MPYVIVVLVGLAFVSAVYAADRITVTIDGTPVHFADQQPVIIDNRTLVPVRGVFEQLGFYVTWDGTAQQATLTREDFTVIISVGSAVFTTNGVSHTLDVPAQIIENRTMLPIRLVLESVGYTLDWNQATQTVLITTVQPEAPAIADVAEYVPAPGPFDSPAPTPTPAPRYGDRLTLADGMAEEWYDIVYRHADGTITVRTNTGNLVRIGITAELAIALGGEPHRRIDFDGDRTGLRVGVGTLGDRDGFVRDPDSYYGQGGRVGIGRIRSGGAIVEVTQSDGTSLGKFMVGDDSHLNITGLEAGAQYRVTLVQPPIGFTNRVFNRWTHSIDANGNPYVIMTLLEDGQIGPMFALIAE